MGIEFNDCVSACKLIVAEGFFPIYRTNRMVRRIDCAWEDGVNLIVRRMRSSNLLLYEVQHMPCVTQ